MTIRRGDILWADLGMFPTTSVQGGVRPVIVVSNNKANGVAHTCWNCQQTVKVPTRIVIGKNTVVLNQNSKLLHHHIYSDFDMETVVGEVVQNPKNPALWGIRNEDKLNWTYEKADGTQIPVEVGKTAGIAAGVKIHFSESVGEFK